MAVSIAAGTRRGLLCVIIGLMGTVTNLLHRKVYAFPQIDSLLGLSAGTAQRWIDGYERQGRVYPPIVRQESTGRLVATWGEFIECRFLAEYRSRGVPMLNMRPSFERLRDLLETPYPLASARLWLSPEGKDIVAQVQEDLGDRLSAVLRYVVRTGDVLLPFDWSPPAARFRDSVRWSDDHQTPVAVWPSRTERQVTIDPLRAFGEPVVRGVQTAVLAELARAGDPVEMIAELYELESEQVQAAIRYERQRVAA